MVVDAPVVVRRQVPEMVQTVQKTVEVPKLQFSCVVQFCNKVVDGPVVVQRQVQETVGARICSSSTWESPSSWTRSLTCPLLFNDWCRKLCFDKVFDVPVMPVESAQVEFLDAGHRQGVDVAVSMQRQGSSCPHRQLRFLSAVHRHGRDELRWGFSVAILAQEPFPVRTCTVFFPFTSASGFALSKC